MTWDNFLVRKNQTGSDHKWPEMTKNDITSKNSIFLLILNFCFFDICKMLHQYFILKTPETIFLVYTGWESWIYNG